jgi:hypothetical protein
MEPYFWAVTSLELSSQVRDFTVFLSIFGTLEGLMGSPAKSLTVRYQSYAIHD